MVKLIVEDCSFDKLFDLVKSPTRYLVTLGMNEAQLKEKWLIFNRRAYLLVIAQYVRILQGEIELIKYYLGLHEEFDKNKYEKDFSNYISGIELISPLEYL